MLHIVAFSCHLFHVECCQLILEHYHRTYKVYQLFEVTVTSIQIWLFMMLTSNVNMVRSILLLMICADFAVSISTGNATKTESVNVSTQVTL